MLRHTRTLSLLLGLGLGALAALAHADNGLSSVVRLHVMRIDGTAQYGSGVLIASERVATACHVTRGAATIEISQGPRRWLADDEVASEVHDLCILHAPITDVPIATIRGSEQLQRKEAVVAAGFQHGRSELVVSRGTVAGLYRHDAGFVIRTSAAFDFGSSGGGLFDEAGNLVGLLAFKARSGDALRFALPVEWLLPGNPVAALLSHRDGQSFTAAFWEQPASDRPAFLGVALREAAGYR